MENNTIGMLGKRGNEFLQTVRKNALKIGVYMLIAGIIMGVIFILVGGDDIWLYFSKTISLFVVVAILAVISSINFKIIEIGNKGAQALALMGLALNFVWAILWMLCIWDVFSINAYVECGIKPHSSLPRMCNDGFTLMGKITLITTIVSAFGLIGSAVLALKDYDRRGAILPLKITTLVGLTYDALFLISMIILDWNMNAVDNRFVIMAGFAGVVWISTAIICAVLAQKARERLDPELKKTVNDDGEPRNLVDDKTDTTESSNVRESERHNSDSSEDTALKSDTAQNEAQDSGATNDTTWDVDTDSGDGGDTQD